MPGHVAVLITGDFSSIIDSLYKHAKTLAVSFIETNRGIHSCLGIDFYFIETENESAPQSLLDLIRECCRKGYRSIFVVYVTNYIHHGSKKILGRICPLLRHSGMMLLVCLTPIETAEDLHHYCRNLGTSFINTERVPDPRRLLERILFTLKTTSNDDVLQELPMPWES